MLHPIEILRGFARTRVSLLGVAVVVVSIVPLLGSAQTLRDGVWITNGDVYDIAYADNVLYLAGAFTRVGTATGSAAAIDLATGAGVQPFPKVFGTVNAVEPDGSGGWYLGGSFTHVRGEPRNNLAHIAANGSLTDWKPSASGTVNALARSGSRVYIGGEFIALGGQPRKRVAAVDATTGALASWNPGVDGVSVKDVHVDGSTVYIAGTFTKAGGQARTNLAAVDAATGSVLSFIADAGSAVYCMALSGSLLYVGGAFTTIGGQARNYLAALDATTGVVTTWNPGTNGLVQALAVVPSTSTVYVGGAFSTLGAASRSNIGAVHASTGAVFPFDPSADLNVRSLSTLPDGLGGTIVLAGGDFTSIGGQARSNLAQLDGDDGSANSWNPRVDAAVHSVAVSGTCAFAGGRFSMIGTQVRNRLAAIDATSGEATSWNPDVTGGTARTLRLAGSILYVGGDFTGVGGQPRNSLAAVSTLNGQVTPWNPNGGSSGTVYTMSLSGGVLYVGGQFGSIGGLPRTNVAAIDPTTGSVLPFQPNVNGSVYTLSVVIPSSPLTAPTVYVGGDFTTVGGLPRFGLASINANTSAPTTWNPGTDGIVSDLIVVANFQGVVSRVYVAGWFSSIAGEGRANIAELNGSGVATSWAPYADGACSAMLLSGNSMFVGGSFYQMGFQARAGLAEIDLTTAEVTGWDPAMIPGDGVVTLLKQGGTVYAGGRFESVLRYPHTNFVGMSDGVVTSVSTEVATPPVGAVRVTPNPSWNHTTLSFSLREPGPAEIAVFDVSGRRVRRIHHGILPAGEQTFDWDGQTDRGTAVSSGVYFLRVTTGSDIRNSKLLRLR